MTTAVPERAGEGTSSGRCYRLTAPNAADTAKLARDHLAVLLAHASLTEHTDTARLLVSEIVTNVFAHTPGPLVDIETTIRPGGLVLVAVQDASARLPTPRHTADDAEGGRGLHLVQLLAAAWGVTVVPQGKRTWFSLSSP